MHLQIKTAAASYAKHVRDHTRKHCLQVCKTRDTQATEFTEGLHFAQASELGSSQKVPSADMDDVPDQ